MHRLDVVDRLVFVNRPYLVAERAGKAGGIGGRAGDDCQRVIGVLGLRQKSFRAHRSVESRAAHVADHADDRDPGIPRIRRAINKTLSYRIFAGKEAPRKGIVDDDYPGGSLDITVIELASAKQRDSHHLE